MAGLNEVAIPGRWFGLSKLNTVRKHREGTVRSYENPLGGIETVECAHVQWQVRKGR